ncbi:MAG: hypothetical protein KGP29_08010, partial [Proteobacteria bacterium]|nr:hypothetical protein [Pseudomonadota bacterium]
MQISLKNYQKSLKKIHKIIDETKQNIVKTVDYQKVVMSWKIGEEIEEHLKNKNQNGYGEKFFSELEKDTKISQRTLYRMQAFHKSYPTLPKFETKLNWSHYRTLSAVKSEETRKYLENLVIENALGSDRLEQVVKKIKSQKKPPKKSPTKLHVTRGKLFTYSLTKDGEVDLGFNIFVLRASCVVLGGESVKIPEARSTKHEARNEFTYVAKLERVVDGDTIHVKLDLGFGIKHHEILRLAKINAPEAETKEGKRA